MKYWLLNFETMTQHELDTIIQSGEGYKTEFKRNVNTDLSKEMVAFANSSGGKIFIGVEDNGTISGVTIDNALKSKITMMAHECDPSVEIDLEFCNNVLIVHVPEGKSKPYRCTNGFYIRNGASSIKLTTPQIIGFIKEEGKVKFDELVHSNTKFTKDIDIAAISRFKELSGISSSINNNELLTNLGVLYADEKKSVLNNTGVLFFSSDAGKLIPQSAVVCVAYKGNSKVTILDKKIFEHDIITNIDEAINFLKRHLNLAYEIKEKRRREKLEIPEVVLREAVVNAVAHRDYFEKGANVMVEIFSNRVEITDPGGLPKGFKPEDFGKRTLARNPLIASLLNRAKYIEKLGTGIQRMRQEMIAVELPEPSFSFEGFFSVTLQRHYSAEKAVAVSLDVSADRLKRMMYLLQLLGKNKPLINAKAANKFKVAESAIRKDLLLLIKKGWIIASGSTSNRAYLLAEHAKEQLGLSKKPDET